MNTCSTVLCNTSVDFARIKEVKLLFSWLEAELNFRLQLSHHRDIEVIRILRKIPEFALAIRRKFHAGPPLTKMRGFLIYDHVSDLLKPQAKLCDKCSQLALHFCLMDGFKINGTQSWNIDELQKSKNNGCPICYMFIASLDPMELALIPKSTKAFAFIPERQRLALTKYITLSFHFSSISPTQPAPKPVHAGVKMYLYKPPTPIDVNQFRKVAATTDDPITWEKAGRWITHCIENHENCRKMIIPLQFPKRLIYIPAADDSFDHIRLCHSKDIPDPQSIKYLALTHCWGGKTPLVTNNHNLNDMVKKIPFQLLSKTFQEAITITFRLGFHYLWIDSLCIIQGDVQDWVHEATRMGSIYANCFLNIVAAGAQNGSVGCFFPRNLEALYGCNIKLANSQESAYGLCAIPSELDVTVSKSYTAGRGWCFQETYLAPRSIYFCKSQIFWECRCHRACESLPGDPDGQPARPLRYHALGGPISEALEPGIEEWIDLVHEYSRRDLTYGKDKLIAIAGIARLFDRSNTNVNVLPETNLVTSDQGATYFAGLWTGCFQVRPGGFEVQLLWYIHQQNRKSLNTEMRAPSWSWASVNAPISIDLIEIASQPSHLLEEVIYYTDIVMRIRGVSAVLTTEDPYGEVTGGRLQLECHVAGPFTMEEDYLWASNGVSGQRTETTTPNVLDGYKIDLDVQLSEKSPRVVYCALGFQIREAQVELPWGLTKHAGLILEKVTPDTFRRIGVYRRVQPMTLGGYVFKDPMRFDKEVTTITIV